MWEIGKNFLIVANITLVIINVALCVFKPWPNRIEYYRDSFVNWLYYVCTGIYAFVLYYCCYGESFGKWETPILLYLFGFSIFTAIMTARFMPLNDALKALVIIPFVGNFFMVDAIQSNKLELMMDNGALYEIGVVTQVTKNSSHIGRNVEWEVTIKSSNIGDIRHIAFSSTNGNSGFVVGDTLIIRMCIDHPKIKEVYIEKPDNKAIENYRKPFILKKGVVYPIEK